MPYNGVRMKHSQQLDDDVRRLREGIGALPEPVVKPRFLMVTGLPGTGKSYFCRRLAERVPLVILESDSLRRLLFPSPTYSTGESARVFRACYALVEDLLKSGTTLALDATNLEEHHRERLYHIADQLGVDLIVVRVVAPPDVVYRRMQGRVEGVNPEDKSEADWEVHRRMRSSVQPIGRNHLVIDTSNDIGPILDRVVRRMNRLS